MQFNRMNLESSALMYKIKFTTKTKNNNFVLKVAKLK